MLKKLILICILFIKTTGINQPLFAQRLGEVTHKSNIIWAVPIQIMIRNNIFDLKIGCYENATDGFDNGIDVIAAPPGFTPYAFIWIDTFPNYLSEDYRSPNQESEWRLQIINAASDSIYISWNKPGLKEGDQLVFNNFIDMKSDTITEFFGNQNIKITYRPNISKVNLSNNNLQRNSFVLFQNYPNPFNDFTIIKYYLPRPCQVEIKIVNSIGQEVEHLLYSRKESGVHQVIWNSRSNEGRRTASGFFFYSVKAGEIINIKKMIILE